MNPKKTTLICRLIRFELTALFLDIGVQNQLMLLRYIISHKSRVKFVMDGIQFICK